MFEFETLVVAGVLGVFGLIFLTKLLKSINIVPSKSARVVERLGKYHKTLDAGLHILVPFIDRVSYTHSLKEKAIEVPDQSCFTKDNVKIRIGGILYYRIMDPKRASYGIKDYRTGAISLAQTTMRSVIGLLDMDKTFEERENINAKISQVLDECTEAWGIKITRYEIQNITVPKSILATMELQLKAERDKRAVIAKSLGEMNSRINNSIGYKEQAINKSEGEMQRRINEAEGKAQEIIALSRATATSIQKIAEALSVEGGEEATQLQLTERLLDEIRKVGNRNTKVVLPLNLGDLESVTKLARLDRS